MSLTNNQLGFIVVHQIQSQIQCMGSNVDDRTTALCFFIQEHAPVGSRSAAQGVSIGVVDLTHSAGVNKLLCIHRICGITALVTDGQLLAGGFSSLTHSQGIGSGLCHRLFTHNMLAGIESIDGDIGMLPVGSQDMDHFDGLVLQQFLIIGVDLGIRGAIFLGSLLSLLRDNVAECHHLHIGQLLQGRHMLTIGDTAAADNAHIYNTFHKNTLSYLSVVY